VPGEYPVACRPPVSQLPVGAVIVYAPEGRVDPIIAKRREGSCVAVFVMLRLVPLAVYSPVPTTPTKVPALSCPALQVPNSAPLMVIVIVAVPPCSAATS
jgi:hypothetical protein